MNHDEALKILRENREISSQQFDLLRTIAYEVTKDPQSKMAMELVLRALECEEQFDKTIEILVSLVRETGLYPYLYDDLDKLNIRDIVALEYHRPEGLEDLIFHQEQAPIYHRLLAGKNVVLSAPTSFGKSKIIDAVIAAHRFRNIVIVVPTIALIDETRRRLQSEFNDEYNIVWHPTQDPTINSNIFIFTPERVISYKDNFPHIDFFVVDEFYKIGGQNEEDKRVIALNEAFYLLYKKHHAQFYMLGPNIRAISKGASERFNFEFISTDFQTVFVEVDSVRAKSEEDRFYELIRICKTLKEPTLIYCKSVPQVNNVAERLLNAGVKGTVSDVSNAADWLRKEFHHGWILPRALEAGIAVHYGPLPRSIAHEMVRFFNSGRIQFLICTSTLIEGVNTKAKNVIIFDNKIAQEKLDYFTFNNIKGRSGRMFQYFIGHVFKFHDEPEQTLPYVDFPLHVQDENTPESLLIQIDSEDLVDRARERIYTTIENSPLPINVLRENHGIEPADQIELAEKILANLSMYHPLLSWSSTPKYKQLEACCDLIWSYWIVNSRNGVNSARQLAFLIWNLRKKLPLAQRIEAELKDGRYAARNPNEAVERVLRFDRNWANFDFPQYLMSLNRIQTFIFNDNELPPGDYSYFAKRVESLFMPELCAVLDEYGIPAVLTEKCAFLYGAKNISDALNSLRRVDFSALKLHPYELELLESAMSVK